MLFKFKIICTLLNSFVIIFVYMTLIFPKIVTKIEKTKEDICLICLILIKLNKYDVIVRG